MTKTLPRKGYDFVFTGGTNASMCLLTKWTDVVKTFELAHKILRTGGVFVCAHFGPKDYPNPMYDVSYQSSEITKNIGYAGNIAHWGSIILHDCIEGFQTYFNVLVVTNKQGIPLEMMFHTTGYRVKTHSTDVIIEIGRDNGFVWEKTPGHAGYFDSSTCLFVKE